jgi:anti-anti-sigma factor
MLLNVATREIQPGLSVIELEGRLTLGRESHHLESLMERLIREGARHLIYDFTSLRYTDSTGIGIVASSVAQTRRAGGEVCIVGAQGVVLQALKISGLNSILTLYASVAEAEKALAGRAAGGVA